MSVNYHSTLIEEEFNFSFPLSNIIINLTPIPYRQAKRKSHDNVPEC